MLPKLLILKPVFAQPGFDPPDGADETLPGQGEAGSIALDNPLGDIDSLPVLVGHLIRAVLGIVGSLALAVFIYGGFVWMTSAGNGNSVNKGKNTLVWAAIGLAVIFSAYALVRYIIEVLQP